MKLNDFLYIDDIFENVLKIFFLDNITFYYNLLFYKYIKIINKIAFNLIWNKKYVIIINI